MVGHPIYFLLYLLRNGIIIFLVPENCFLMKTNFAQKLINECKQTKSTILDLGNLGLRKIPKSLWDCVWLEQLNFGDFFYVPKGKIFRKRSSNQVRINQLSIIPKEIEQLSRLQILSFSKNRIHKLENLNNLTKLKALYLNNNRISKIENIENLTNLKILYLNNNQILTIENLNKLGQLIDLRLTGNRISHVQNLNTLQNLQILFLNVNQISNIDLLDGLDHLKELHLNSNKITSLKPLIPLMKKGMPVKWATQSIGSISIKDCPLVIPPIDIVKRGNGPILKYFKEIEEKATVINNEVKFIVIGNSTAGKTSLINFLRNKVYSDVESTTEGITVNSWEPDDSEIKVTVWDFGGQEYYHATHRLFLSNNAVYAMVFDVLTNRSHFSNVSIHYEEKGVAKEKLEMFKFQYWLYIIRRYADNSDIFSIQTKLDLADQKTIRLSDKVVKKYLLEEEKINFRVSILKTFDYLKHKKKENQRWWTRYNYLEAELIHALKTSAIKWTLVKHWIDIKEELKRLSSRKKHITYNELEQIIKGNKENTKGDEYDVELAIIYLREITSTILFYPNNPVLKNIVFIDPIWLTQEIYSVLNYKVKENKGKFNKTHVQENTNNPDQLIALMKSLELIFETNDVTEEYIAPQYLPFSFPYPKKLKDVIQFATLSLTFVLHFPEFVLRGMMAQFIARTGITATRKYFWKFGILFQKKLSVYVECFHKKKCIEVSIQTGPPDQRDDLAKYVLNTFLEIYDSEDFSISLNQEHKVEWKNLMEAVQNGDSEIKPKNKPAIPIKHFNFLIQKDMKNNIPKVFISYSRKDKEHLDSLKTQLSYAQRQGKLELWDDNKIIPGEKWDESIKVALATADIILFLVSSRLLATNYVAEVEMATALERHQVGSVILIPIIVKACPWNSTPLGAIQALPRKGKPLSQWSDEDEYWWAVSEEILAVCDKWTGS